LQSNDPWIVKHLHLLEEVFRNGRKILVFPWLRHIAPEWSGHTSMKLYYDSTRAMLNRVITEHEEDFDLNSTPKV
jgi:hypothetical protein